MSEQVQPAEPRGLRRLYAWMMKNAQGPHAWWALAAFAFAEASFFPIPPDVMLLPMMLANRRRALIVAAWCTLFSVIGGMAGYAIGHLFWDTAGVWLISILHIPLEQVEALRAKYASNAFLIAVQGLTPIPFKLVTISAGLAAVPFGAFVLYAAMARSVRFIVLEGLLVYFLGDHARVLLEKYMEWVLIGFLVLVVLGFVALRYVF
ncbi:MAG: DedA family protein [Alphaproteobacteria bacterium]|nr:DedA family protein [Alphaproteobacteria bacterium]MBV9419008.1 DedA family protein [Alphaproteobacteria bacterium]MBV9540263.1 DedA family protein [Alphaproteobacteria bacterium]MBV9903158.1 DedA family protein [Alphaproteobacteria bacterium]